MRSIVRRQVLEIKPYIPGKPIEEVKRELRIKDVIKLASNENPYGPSPGVLKAIAKEAKNLNRYPDGGCFHLRKALSKRLKVNENQLVFGNGSDEIIVMATKAFLGEGDEVIVAKPSFLIYDIASRLSGARVVEVPLDHFRYDLKRMKNAVTDRTRIIFIGNPDNPAGTYVTKDQLEEFLKEIPKNILVFVDEAYYEFASTRKGYPDSLKYIPRYENLLVARTFSKMYGLAGLRIGYGIGQESLVDLLNRVREPFNVNSLAQVAALACLNDQAYYGKIAKKLEKERIYLYGSLKRMKAKYLESATNFILIDVQKDGSQVSKALLKKGVIVRDMAFWGLKNFIRVTIGKTEENRKFIKALKEVL